MMDQIPPALEAAYLRAVYSAPDISGRWHRFTFGGFGDNPARLPYAPPWTIITAWNPRSVPASPADNHAAQDRLHAAIKAIGLDARPALGRDPADPPAWQEESLLIENIEVAVVVRLLREFRQHAAVYSDAQQVGLLYADTEEWRNHPVRLLPPSPTS
jgi:hypothetical protein